MLQIYKKMCAKQNKSIKTYQGICFFITFGFAEDTSARQNKEKLVFLWFCARLFVLWLRRRYFRSEKQTKTPFCLVFRSLNRIFAPEINTD